MPTLDKKPVSVTAVRAAAALATENAHRVEPALVTVASSPETPQSSSATEAAVMARIQSIMAAAGEGQERLCIELITQGKSELEAVKALNADLKAKNAELESRLLLKEAELPAEPKKPEVSKEEVVAELLKRYQAAAPQIPPTASQGEPNVYEKFKSIEDPVERQAFYEKHKEEIQSLSRTSKKEGK